MGILHPDYLQDKLTSKQFSDWIAFVRVDGPLSGQRQDRMLAQLTATLWNCNRGKNQTSVKTEDFMLHYEKPEQTPEQMISIIRQAKASAQRKEWSEDGRS